MLTRGHGHWFHAAAAIFQAPPINPAVSRAAALTMHTMCAIALGGHAANAQKSPFLPASGTLTSHYRPPRTGMGSARFQRLSRIALKCSEPEAAVCIKAALSLIEHEWKIAQGSRDKRMIVEIGNTDIRTIRK